MREDSLKFQGARKKMVEKVRQMLEQEGLQGETVLKALAKVPRHFFFDSAFDLKFAYENTAFKIGAGQTISQPFTVAAQTILLEVQKRHKVLEIGTGSGYQATILMELGAKLFSIERQRLLYDRAQKMLPAMGYRPRLFFGDGYKGLPAYAPFDRIIVTAGAPHVPQALLDQLAAPGILVIPVGEGESQDMLRVVKDANGATRRENWGKFSFVPMLANTANEK